MADESLAAFMDVTGCSYDDAFHRLASCGGHLGIAINQFFSIDAGSSGTRRSPPPSDSESDDDEAPARAPVPSDRRALGGAAAAARPRTLSEWVSRWDSETPPPPLPVGGGSKSSRRRRRARRVKKARRDIEAASSQGHGEHQNVHRRRRLDMFASSFSDEEKAAAAEANNSRHNPRRRLNPKEEAAEANNSRAHLNHGKARTNGGGGGGEKKVVDRHGNSVSLTRSAAASIVISDSDEPSKRKSEKDELFRTPHGLTWQGGGFHEAKVHAARRGRWLLVNVQSLELASLVQNRDVWASDLVAQCVRAHFVLWQADADGDDGEEALKVLCYYKVPRDRLPVVLVVDPVTGQAVDRFHSTDPNDFLVSMAPYTDMKPILPVVKAAAAASAAAAAQSNQKPAATAAPASRWQEQATAVRKPAEPVVAAAAAVQQQPAAVTKVCKMRVRLHDGRVVEKEFGSQYAVAALFAYCRSEMGAGAAVERPFWLLRFAGAARVEIGDENASFESLRLHMSTVSVELG